MGKTRYLFKKIRDTKGTFHAKMGSIKDKNGMDLKEQKLKAKEKRKVKVKSESEVAQSCPTLCDHVDCSLSGSSVHGILQNTGVSFPTPEYLPDLGIEPGPPALQADSLPTELGGKPSSLSRSIIFLYFFALFT